MTKSGTIDTDNSTFWEMILDCVEGEQIETVVIGGWDSSFGDYLGREFSCEEAREILSYKPGQKHKHAVYVYTRENILVTAIHANKSALVSIPRNPEGSCPAIVGDFNPLNREPTPTRTGHRPPAIH